MKFIHAIPALIMLALMSGCATEGFVNRQVDPMADRLGKVESRLTAIEVKLAGLEKGAAAKELSPADQAALKEARDLARGAFEKACKVEADVKRAEDAARDAEGSAKKSRKMFELQQKK